MEPVEGARTFSVGGEAYDLYMGRYSRALAPKFADAVDVRAGMRVLDVGCGPGALTSELVTRVGASEVSAFDPSPSFVHDCRERHPGVDVREGRAEAIPFDDAGFDAALSQLVLHFVSDPTTAAAEMRRVVRPGGTVAACVWSFDGGMEMLRRFWSAALAVDPGAPDESNLRFGRPGEIADLLRAGGLADVVESTLTVTSTYASFDELWSGFLTGIGPAGSYCVGLPDEQRAAVRARLVADLGSPSGPLSLTAMARCARGLVPG